MAGKSRILFLTSLIVCISVAVSMGFGKFQQLFPCDENHRCEGQPTCRKLSSCDVNTTNVTEQLKPNTSTVQSVPSHVTSNFQNGGETSNMQSSSYLTYNQQTASVSSSVQSFLSQVTPEFQTVSDSSPGQSISPEPNNTIDRTATVSPFPTKTSEPPPPTAMSSLSPISSVQSFLSHVTSDFQTVIGSSARRSISPEAITTFETTAAVTPSSPNTSERQPPLELSTANLFQCSCTNGLDHDGKACNSPTDCDDVYKSCNQSDGVYSIKPKDWQGSAFDVFCNMDDSGGWTVIQRRGEGELNVFDKDWDKFKGTFGDMRPGKEFWLGNEKIYHLTNQKTYILRIDFQCKDDSTYFAEYSSFRIGNEIDKYRVTELGVYNGNAGGQPLVTLKNGACPFTTSDTYSGSHPASCPAAWRNGWWFCSGICIESNLNDWDWGGKEIYWEGLGDIKHTEMKIRPKN